MNGLERLLRPRSVAVIGGGAWGPNVIEQCRKIGFAGEIWPVHPRHREYAGLPAYPDIASLPQAPDAAFVGVNRDATIDVVAQLAARGAGGAVCFASGFLEAQAEAGDGAAKQSALLAAADGMTLLGPNCYGYINYLDGAALWPDQHGGEVVSSGVAIISQSSNIAINLTMQQRGLPLAYVVTVGNQAQTDLADIGIALLRDERVTALGMYIEGIRELRGFEALAAEARRRGTPLVALKVGKSNQAQAATVSHTASLAGSDAGAQALLSRLQIGQASSLATLLEALKLFHVAGPLDSTRIASLSCSGGEASLMADTAYAAGLSFPPLNDRQQTDLRALLGPKVALANPLDYQTTIWGDEDALAKTFTAMMTPEIAIGVVVLDFPRSDRCSAALWDPVINAAARAKQAGGRPLAILGSLSETMPEDIARRLVDLGIVPLAGMRDGLEALAIGAAVGRQRPAAAPLLLPGADAASVVLSEADAKSVLAQYGVMIPRGERASSAAAAAQAAQRIGFPVALKCQGIAHKTEAGAVALNLHSADAVRAAAMTMTMTMTTAMPGDHFLVEEMVAGTAEVLIGVVRDPAHGMVLSLAAGGALTELLSDSASLLLPAARSEVLDALDSLQIAALLNGYRGAPGVDKRRIVDAVMAVQAYVAAQRPQEIEINPLICSADKAVAADALVRAGVTNTDV